MCAELREHDAGKTVANQISVLRTLVNLKVGKGTEMDDPVSKIERLLDRLARMSMQMAEFMQVAISLVSLGSLTEYNGTVESIKTVDVVVATCQMLPGEIFKSGNGFGGILQQRRQGTPLLCWIRDVWYPRSQRKTLCIGTVPNENIKRTIGGLRRRPGKMGTQMRNAENALKAREIVIVNVSALCAFPVPDTVTL